MANTLKPINPFESAKKHINFLDYRDLINDVIKNLGVVRK